MASGVALGRLRLFPALWSYVLISNRRSSCGPLSFFFFLWIKDNSRVRLRVGKGPLNTHEPHQQPEVRPCSGMLFGTQTGYAQLPEYILNADSSAKDTGLKGFPVCGICRKRPTVGKGDSPVAARGWKREQGLALVGAGELFGVMEPLRVLNGMVSTRPFAFAGAPRALRF